jgi:hypothetical protein
MAMIYFPSCKFQAAYPETAKKVTDYVTKIHGMVPTGCCRGNLQKLSEEDIAIYICNTCSAFCDESSKAYEVISIWEIIAEDKNFPFPDYQGEKITIQDCWRAYDKRSVQNAIRALMKKMNLQIVELDENYEKTRFCGTSVLQKPPSYYKEFAPQRFCENAPKEFFQDYSKEDLITAMNTHCANIKTEKVATYCIACTNGLKSGGKKAIHLMELLFDTNLLEKLAKKPLLT